MDKAVQRLRKATEGQERIRVVTDYDVDGTTSSLILQSTLRLLGLTTISYHIPDRMKEGYGFSVTAAERAHEDGIDLILTADIGVKDHEAVARAHELGIDVLICDHHLPSGASVPDHAIVLCPPQQGCTYTNKALAACGVSWKLADALLAEHPKRQAILKSLLKLVAIGTVADVVDLSCAENRAIVRQGLEELNTGRHTPGLKALLEVAGLKAGTISSTDLGFRVGPRINAAGRLASATSVVDLLQCRDAEAAREKAQALDQMNSERRAIQDRILEQAIAQVTEESPQLVVVSGSESEGWHRGVTGIVAGRLRDHFGCPALVISTTEAGAVGSMRSTPEVHAVRLLEDVSETLERFGGHPAAAGFSLATASVDAFRSRLHTAVEKNASGTRAPAYSADLQIPAEEISGLWCRASADSSQLERETKRRCCGSQTLISLATERSRRSTSRRSSRAHRVLWRFSGGGQGLCSTKSRATRRWTSWADSGSIAGVVERRFSSRWRPSAPLTLATESRSSRHPSPLAGSAPRCPLTHSCWKASGPTSCR